LRNWGATSDEVAGPYRGDELLDGPVSGATNAVTVQAPADEVWSWLVQIGQDRGGMYSYESLENLFGLNIHNATEIREEWQHLAVGDPVRVVPAGKFGLRDGYAFHVAIVEPPYALVLRQQPPEHPWDSTWAFLVVPTTDDQSRLISRTRAAVTPGLKGVVSRFSGALMGPVILLMTRKMLLGIRERAERHAPSSGTDDTHRVGALAG
jgi:hypothetical protein